MLAVASDRSVAVLGSAVGDLTVVDLVHLRRLGAVATDVPGDAALGWSWVGRSRLLLIGTAGEAATEVLAVDVGARRVVRRQRLDGVVQGYVRLLNGLALLLSPANAIGRARLVVSDADAGLRTVTLTEISAGFKQLEDTNGSGPRVEQAVPGITADPAGQRVYVVPAGAPPLAEAKVVSGPWRNALWLGDGLLAVTGRDGSATGQHMEIPSGLELIDTANWTVRQVDRHSTTAMPAAGRLLAFGTAFGTGQGGLTRVMG
jgi:hypothetical protein